VVLYAFVLMDNHFHLLVRTPRANLSRFMQRLKTSYALYARYKHRRPGHVFEARFKAKVVQDESYLLALTRYIHLNPIKTAAGRRLASTERVDRLEGYAWSSYPGYVEAKRAVDWVCYAVLNEYSPRLATARRLYLAYTHAGVLDDDREILAALQTSRYAIGDEPFVEETERKLARLRRGRPQDADLALPQPICPIEAIDRAVAAHFGVRPEALQAHGHTAGTAKVLAVELACRWAGWTHRAIGEHYGRMTSAAVSNIRRKVRDGTYPIAELVEKISQGSDFRQS
jgi:hypothetical protein